MTLKEKPRKPKCKGVWKGVTINGVWCYQCTKCGKRLTPQQGYDAINHRDL